LLRSPRAAVVWWRLGWAPALVNSVNDEIALGARVGACARVGAGAEMPAVVGVGEVGASYAGWT
jgi:hypothetical protein